MIRTIQFRLHIEFERELNQHFPEALFRGAFGYALKNLVCVNRNCTDCATCHFRAHCAFGLSFVPRSNTGPREIGDDTAPVPPILFYAHRRQFGKVQYLDCILLEPLHRFAAYIIETFRQLGSRGIGKQELRYALVRVWNMQNGNDLFKDGEFTQADPEVRDIKPWGFPEYTVGQCRVRLTSPLRIRERKRWAFSPTPRQIVKFSLLRITRLENLYGHPEHQNYFSEILKAAERIKLVSSELSIEERRRFSSRQNARQTFLGVIGDQMWEAVDGSIVKLIAAVGSFGIGKNTTFGFGRITCEAAEGD